MNDIERIPAVGQRRPAHPTNVIRCLAALALAAAAAATHAEPVGAALSGAAVPLVATATSTTLLSESVLTRGAQSFAFDLSAPGAGTFEIRLSDLAWPDRLASLSFSLSSATSVLKTLQGPGLLTLQVGAAGTYFANVATRTQGSLGMGLYALDVQFAEASLPVPLPGSAWLLVAAAATLAGLLHRGNVGAGTKPAGVAGEDGMPAGCPA